MHTVEQVISERELTRTCLLWTVSQHEVHMRPASSPWNTFLWGCGAGVVEMQELAHGLPVVVLGVACQRPGKARRGHLLQSPPGRASLLGWTCAVRR